MGMSWSLWLSIAVKSFSKWAPHLLNELTANAGPLKACLAALGGPTDQAMHEGKGRAASREFGKVKGLVGHGEATHLLQRIEGKKDRLLNDLMKNDNRRK
jgi:hypothetical protein